MAERRRLRRHRRVRHHRVEHRRPDQRRLVRPHRRQQRSRIPRRATASRPPTTATPCTTSTSSGTSRHNAVPTSWITASTSATRTGCVANNIAYDNAGFGIQCWHNCNALYISNNLVFGNGRGRHRDRPGRRTEQRRRRRRQLHRGQQHRVDNGRDGIRESGATGPNNQFVNNIMWNNGTKRINLQDRAADAERCVADPDFVDFQPDGSGDYHLRPGSPASGRRRGARSADKRHRRQAAPAEGRGGHRDLPAAEPGQPTVDAAGRAP